MENKCDTATSIKKTVVACAWLAAFIERVGDKQSDKDWIYLPTCLTESKMYEMLEEAYSGSDDSSSHISYSKLSLIFNEEFKIVSIPKVSCIIVIIAWLKGMPTSFEVVTFVIYNLKSDIVLT